MLNCKNGDFERENSQRWNSNNSYVMNSNMPINEFIDHFMSMVRSERGEPGIYNRDSAYNKPFTNRIWSGKPILNPCAEIELDSTGQMCNLSISIARENDTISTLSDKVAISSIIGTIQSMATYFPGLRQSWVDNCTRDRLLGCDINGQLDCEVVQNAEVMSKLRGVAIETNRLYANRLGINQSASVTCVKPGGNSSQLANCSSGLHARWAPYYIRNVRISAHSPLFKVMRDAGFPMSPENGQVEESADTWVLHFAVKSPDGSITRNDRSAVEQCEYWLLNKLNWTTHNPSCTINYNPNEIIDLMKWIWDHKDVIGGLAFLPSFDAKYDQLPYIEITEEEYNKMISSMPDLDFSKVYRYEFNDSTENSLEVSCMSGACDMQL